MLVIKRFVFKNVEMLYLNISVILSWLTVMPLIKHEIIVIYLFMWKTDVRVISF